MTQTSSYKGNPTLSLMNKPDDRYPFTFGLAKAKLILANLGDIQKFVEGHAPKGWDRFDTAVEDQNAERCGLARGGQ